MIIKHSFLQCHCHPHGGVRQVLQLLFCDGSFHTVAPTSPWPAGALQIVQSWLKHTCWKQGLHCFISDGERISVLSAADVLNAEPKLWFPHTVCCTCAYTCQSMENKTAPWSCTFIFCFCNCSWADWELLDGFSALQFFQMWNHSDVVWFFSFRTLTETYSQLLTVRKGSNIRVSPVSIFMYAILIFCSWSYLSSSWKRPVKQGNLKLPEHILPPYC